MNQKHNFFLSIIIIASLFFSIEALNYHNNNNYKSRWRPQISFFTDEPASNGPARVASSVFRGMQKLGISFNVNEKNYAAIAPIVVVLGNPASLQRIMHYKNQGSVEILIAGPNVEFILYPHTKNMSKSPLIDCFLIPCEWVKHVFERFIPHTVPRTRIWYAGVEAEHWKPTNPGAPKNKVIIYNKFKSDLVAPIIEYLHNFNWEPIVLNYGSYNQAHYKSCLDEAAFAIFLSQSESQGIAMAEAWSMNVPTLVWNPKQNPSTYFHDIEVSSSPYLTEMTGRDWVTFDDLVTILSNWSSIVPTLAPRNWILSHMTDIKSAEMLLNIIDDIRNKKT